jgi:hypothetical protein
MQLEFSGDRGVTTFPPFRLTVRRSLAGSGQQAHVRMVKARWIAGPAGLLVAAAGCRWWKRSHDEPRRTCVQSLRM